jgi:hypothetical protein
MADKITMEDSQVQKLIASVDALVDRAPYWQHFLVTALPIFLASLLGLATALLLDWLKNRRERDKTNRERLEKELALMSGANTAIGFNIEALTHIVMQQVLPHHKQSHAVCLAIDALRNGVGNLETFNELLHSEFASAIRRCPDPYLEDINFSRDLPFLIERDPSLIILSGWIITCTRNVKAILNERNKLIDIETTGNTQSAIDLPTLGRHLAAQAHISEVEVVNVYQLLLQLAGANNKIAEIIKTEYKEVKGPKLKVQLPQPFESMMSELKAIANEVVDDCPPPEAAPSRE